MAEEIKQNESQQTGLPPPHPLTYVNNDDEKKYEPSEDTTKKMTSLFSEMKKFDKVKLKETETVVKHIIRVTDYTAHLDEEEAKEFYTDPFLVKKLAVRFANMLKESKHTVFHTGAGVSTAAKLPDYRGMCICLNMGIAISDNAFQ